MLDLYDFESRAKTQKMRAGYGFYSKIQTDYTTDMDPAFQAIRKYDAKAHVSRRIDVKTDKLNKSGSIIQLEPMSSGGKIIPTVYQTYKNSESKYNHRKTFTNVNTPDGDYPLIYDVVVALPTFTAYKEGDECASKQGNVFLGNYVKDMLTIVGSMYDDYYPSVNRTESDK